MGYGDKTEFEEWLTEQALERAKSMKPQLLAEFSKLVEHPASYMENIFRKEIGRMCMAIMGVEEKWGELKLETRDASSPMGNLVKQMVLDHLDKILKSFDLEGWLKARHKEMRKTVLKSASEYLNGYEMRKHIDEALNVRIRELTIKVLPKMFTDAEIEDVVMRRVGRQFGHRSQSNEQQDASVRRMLKRAERDAEKYFGEPAAKKSPKANPKAKPKKKRRAKPKVKTPRAANGTSSPTDAPDASDNPH
jgi:hypothetical protein